MANTNKAAQVVARIRGHMTTILDLADAVQGTLNRYTQNGGEAFIADFWLDADGQPRTDLDVTQAQIVAAAAKLTQLKTWVDTNIQILVRAE